MGEHLRISGQGRGEVGTCFEPSLMIDFQGFGGMVERLLCAGRRIEQQQGEIAVT